MTLIDPAAVHEPTEACAVWHCHSHDVDEHHLGPYLLCRECRHRFQDPADLRRDYRAEVANDPLYLRIIAALTPAARIRFCPHCDHDF